MSHVIEITEQSFERDVTQSPLPVLVDFTATWCGPCRLLAPLVERFADASAGRVRVGKVDLDTAPELTARLGVRSAPTLIVFRDGREVARHVGTAKLEKIEALVASRG